MRDLSGRVPELPPSSMSATNTMNDPSTPTREVTAPGSPSVLPPPPAADTDVVVDVAGGSTVDYAHTVGEGGGRDSRPAQGGQFREAGGYDPPSVWGSP